MAVQNLDNRDRFIILADIFRTLRMKVLVVRSMVPPKAISDTLSGNLRLFMEAMLVALRHQSWLHPHDDKLQWWNCCHESGIQRIRSRR